MVGAECAYFLRLVAGVGVTRVNFGRFDLVQVGGVRAVFDARVVGLGLQLSASGTGSSFFSHAKLGENVSYSVNNYQLSSYQLYY